MILHTDHYFSMGQRHFGQGSPCQDFALSGHDGAAFAIVADGCSMGGHTDVGSRLIALLAAQAIKSCMGKCVEFLPTLQIQQEAGIAASSRMLGLSQQDMLATCVYAVLSSKGGFAHLQGDGVIALKYRNGAIRMHRYEWAPISDTLGGAPAYLAYTEDNYSGYIKMYGGDLKATKFSVASWDFIPGSGFKELGTKGIALGDGIKGITLPITEQDLADGLEFIAVFTDGVCQIENQDWKQAVVDLLAFKGIAGAFAKRRMRRHIEDSQKSGKGPIDDIAYAVIRVEREVQ